VARCRADLAPPPARSFAPAQDDNDRLLFVIMRQIVRTTLDLDDDALAAMARYTEKLAAAA
jgi:hypothetical protein